MIHLTPENYDAMISQFKEQIEDGSVEFEYRIYEGDKFLTACDSWNYVTTINAYQDFNIRVESWLHGLGIDDSVRD